MHCFLFKPALIACHGMITAHFNHIAALAASLSIASCGGGSDSEATSCVAGGWLELDTAQRHGRIAFGRNLLSIDKNA